MLGTLFTRFRRGAEKTASPAVRNGSIALMRGIVTVKAPTNGGRPAALGPGDAVTVLVNDVEITEAVDVYPEDRILLVPTGTVSEDRYAITVTDDKMQAAVVINRLGLTVVADEPPAALLTPRMATIPGTTVTVLEIEEALMHLGVCFGVDRPAIEAAITAADGLPYTIANGAAMQPGDDTQLHWLVSEAEAEEPSEDRVDFRERPGPLTVQVGMEIAEVIAPTDGQPGRTVLGAELPSKPGRTRHVKTGAGVTLTPESLLIATLAGRPNCSENDKSITVNVVQLYEHRGDVDLTTGNLRVKGDVLIKGNVTENMEVSATGAVTVTGNVTRAQIRAGGNIAVHGIAIGSYVTAGETTDNSIGPSLTMIDDLLGILVNVVSHRTGARQLEQLEQSGIGPYLLVTIKQQMPDLFQLVSHTVGLIHELTGLDEEMEQLCSTLLRSPMFEGRVQLIRHFADLLALRDLIAVIRTVIEADRTDAANVRVGSCEHSNVTAAGDIVVDKLGTYLSTIQAQGLIRVTGPVIGGSLHTLDRIELRQAGNAAEVQTNLEVSEEGSIAVDQAFPGVRYKVGLLRLRVNEVGPLTEGRTPNQPQPGETKRIKKPGH